MPVKAQSFAEMLEELKAAKPAPAPVDTIPERKYFLIVSEGARTEPLYFQSFRDQLPKEMVSTIDIHGAGTDTIRVVQAAIDKREERRKSATAPPYDEVWAVFDKDDFPAHNYDNAVALADANGISSGHSNQCFELWYLLHFQYLDTAIRREQYFDRLTEILGFRYAKNTPEVVQHIRDQGNVQFAIRCAVQLEKMHTGNTPALSCPHTNVYQLVKNLLAYVPVNS